MTSNREAGLGRHDALVAPRQAGGVGAVWALKVPDRKKRESPKQALAAAVAQVRERKYTVALTERGAGSVRCWPVVFGGKRVLLELFVSYSFTRPLQACAVGVAV